MLRHLGVFLGRSGSECLNIYLSRLSGRDRNRYKVSHAILGWYDWLSTLDEAGVPYGGEFAGLSLDEIVAFQ